MKLLLVLLLCARCSHALDLPRLCVLTDIGGDPDDQQWMVRLMVYANEFRIEGLIASAAGTPNELKTSITRPDLIREIVTAYGIVRPNLLRHAAGWPKAAELQGCIKSGNPLRGREHIGAGHATEGSRWLVQRIDAGSPEHPLNLSIWGGQTDLAQALWQVKSERGAVGLALFVRHFRVFDINDQDGIGDWMRAEFPGMNYILARAPPGRDRREGAYRGIYLGGDESLTSAEWIERHVRSKGPLGQLYPMKTWTAPNPHGCSVSACGCESRRRNDESDASCRGGPRVFGARDALSSITSEQPRSAGRRH